MLSRILAKLDALSLAKRTPDELDGRAAHVALERVSLRGHRTLGAAILALESDVDVLKRRNR
jgi:hypothetical protein